MLRLPGQYEKYVNLSSIRARMKLQDSYLFAVAGKQIVGGVTEAVVKS